MIALSDRITDSLLEESYYWNKPWGVKRFESLILAKFFMEYSFNIISEDKLQDTEKIAFYNLCNSSFSNLFNSEFSEIGLNYEDMEEDVQIKIDAYFEARRSCKPPLCWHLVYQEITKSNSRDVIQEDIKKKTAGLELIRGNESFVQMVPQYESEINKLKGQYNAFESAEMMLPHMARFTKDRLRIIKLKKIKTLSKKIEKLSNAKK